MHRSAVAGGRQKRAPDSMELESQAAVSQCERLGAELGSSARAV